MTRSLWQRLLFCALGLGMMLFLSRLDWAATSRYLAQLGAAAPLVVLPYSLVLGFDTVGWRASFETPALVRYWPLWRLRAATEALANSLPAGVAVGETLKTVLLTRRFGITLADATANVIVSKVALAIAHACFLLLGLGLGARTLLAFSTEANGHPGMLGLYAAIIVGFLGLLLAAAKLAQGGTLSRLLVVVMRFGPVRAQHSLARLQEPLARLDQSLAVIQRLPKRQIARSIGGFFLGWLALGAENWLILSLLTPHAEVSTALSMEAIVSIVRMAFFFVPAGLGAQDVSYYALLHLWGVPDAQAVATAFMLLKRAKEAAWITLGYVLLWLRPAEAGSAQRSLAL
ncbi:MAG: lysylphosphatidylglycerol synthase domain-containing protein [Polyangiales bacterium]